MTAVIEAHHVCKTVELGDGQPLTILSNLDFRIDAGTVVSIRGRSGSGKTTLLSILGLLDTPTSGALRIAGADVAQLRASQRAFFRGANLGFVFQNYSLIPHYSALHNVMLPMLYGGGHASLRAARDRATRTLEAVGLADRLSSLPKELSGGEQQRVSIARAMVRQPQVILADEPTGALDAATADAVMAALIDQTRRRGLALVIVTHDSQVAARADIQYELRAGALRLPGRDNPAEFEAPAGHRLTEDGGEQG